MTQPDAETLARMIDAGQGRVPADLVVRNVRLLDVMTGAVTETDVAVVADRIVGTHACYDGIRVVDGRGRFCVPGFIDTHLHVESSLVTPFEFDRGVLPHGVTTAICDPHEIANVVGTEGIRYFLAAAERTVMDLRVNLSSCVPATDFETSGARLGVEDLLPLAGHPKVIGLAEMMNFPGVLAKAPDVLAKLAAFQGRHVDGHAPLLGGLALNGYLAAGIRTDHEATTAREARAKLAKGMAILIRDGSVSKDLPALAEVLDENTSSFVALCTDDRNPLDIIEHGHLDGMIRALIARGRPRHHVYRAASWSAARIFGLSDRGLVAPGWRADFVLVDDLDRCDVTDVVSAGRLVEPALFDAREIVPPVGLGSMRAPAVGAADFRIDARGNAGPRPVIGVEAGLIITRRREAVLPVEDGAVRPDPAQDVVKVCVVERHGKSGSIGRAFVHGFGMRRGAIASSVGHDSHNVTVVGVDDADMALAVNRLQAIGGGFAVAEGGRILAELALPVAGLMSLEPFAVVQDALVELRTAARALGCTLPEPFLQVAFLPLPVIPHLKITDRGLFDVDAFAFVEE
ncbi:adenine deaminase [Oharaeibacter diazotrophicus]|uniref:Adenine deaminase n=1 Tax=Oharaeibacter diazotrophicus TaxID=1920512 RepID=A0A4R6RCV9_9HYPH|nr:adenine deaminase [Oharaeibacter diazotrophicus]TDP83526.1 adenine deaminase [Oharaeibacter diazotrophicus]BBE72359.1 adenine deaminase [Pleomorphomonas sp. SM30]GLS79130.1 adenine deaminase [Oharaeibacter diazotrophicus]